MRFLQVFFLGALAVLFFFGSCAARKSGADGAAAGSGLTGGRWQLIELNGQPVPAMVNGKMPYLEFSEEEGRYSSTGGCNGVGGEYELSKSNGIKFGRGMSTMMYCDDMTIENGLKQLFEQADTYKVDAGTLLLSKGKGNVLAKFAMLEDQSGRLAGTWELDYIMEAGLSFDSLYASRKPTISFDPATKKVNGNSSCNNFFGTFELNGNDIQFGPLGSTKMACPGNGEQVFFKGLEKINRFDVHGDVLNMIMGDIAVMRFKRK
ncbi:META domain-containing protein [Sphingobacterium griseoflavum]|uniref:DUF306 domain-containing protein n=1 Tax=Sphingobacterium griseoflavum TaxID=1474952 RepID=A0ABQ3I0W6_9SPHI|nr:META domain-containing protein [Sphingobacterium griseoflavum]GHE43678.1 hypothetical protein GCM10017764_28720 [Sphingobacterium griseoflavum]